jgi:hypothetical protein
MSYYCQDRDILSIEPIVFLGAAFPSQSLIAGSNSQSSGTTFTASGANFNSAGVEAGMVLCTYDTTPAEGSAYEIVSVDSATTLTVSVLRADTDDDSVAPPALSDVSFYIRTYAAQIAAVSETLGEKLRQMAEVSGVATADFADSAQLRAVAAYGSLAEIFVARADNAAPNDANWIKGEHYRKLHRQMLLQLRLVADTDGDGDAEQTRSLGNMTLRRT